ncbi:MAG: DUF3137 domain-containing protein [Pseudomonadota bacterium]
MTDSTEPLSISAEPVGDRISLDDLGRQLQPAVGRLETERQAVRKGTLTRAGAGIGGGVVLALLLWLFGVGLFIAIIIFVLGTVGSIALASWHVRSFKDRAATALAPPVAAAIGEMDYERSPFALPEVEDFFDLKVVPRGNRTQFADCLRGRHRGTDFFLVECKVVKRTRTHSQGKTRNRSTTVFNGLLVRVSVPVSFDGTVFIGRDFGNIGNWLSGLVKKIGDMQPVTFPDSAFEQHYEVYADNEDTARRLIGKDFADAMVRIDDMAKGGRPRAAFSNGRFYLSLPWRGGFMEPVGVWRQIEMSPEWLQEIVDEMTLPHRIIDTLHGEG